jgi:hypothetical protein
MMTAAISASATIPIDSDQMLAVLIRRNVNDSRAQQSLPLRSGRVRPEFGLGILESFQLFGRVPGRKSAH